VLNSFDDEEAGPKELAILEIKEKQRRLELTC
jgi:hypothetical protein